MLKITSSVNKAYKRALKARSSKGRKKEGVFLVDSFKLFFEGLMAGLDYREVYLNNKGFEKLEEIENKFRSGEDEYRNSLFSLKNKANFYLLEDKLFDKLSYFQNPDGIIGLAEGGIVNDLDRLLFDLTDYKSSILLLDRIRDPGNMGTLIRSAEAFSFGKIISLDSVDFFNEKTLRASMGSAFRLDLYEITNDDLEKFSKSCNLPIIGADMAGEDLFSKDRQEMVLVIGNEGSGLSMEIRDICDSFVSIKMDGKVESLNAAVSGSILMALKSVKRLGMDK